MKSFKKVLALVLVAAMLFTFAACGKNKGDDLSSEFTENNTVYKPIEVTPENNFLIWGVVTWVIKKM